VAIYFLDTSAVVKRYVLEIGTAWIQALTDPAAGNVHCIARITPPETVAAITRRVQPSPAGRGGPGLPGPVRVGLASVEPSPACCAGTLSQRRGY
jgi:hypothetical protein